MEVKISNYFMQINTDVFIYKLWKTLKNHLTRFMKKLSLSPSWSGWLINSSIHYFELLHNYFNIIIAMYPFPFPLYLKYFPVWFYVSSSSNLHFPPILFILKKTYRLSLSYFVIFRIFSFISGNSTHTYDRIKSLKERYA